MNCNGLFDKQAKTVSEGSKINSSRLTQTGYSNKKEGYMLIEKRQWKYCLANIAQLLLHSVDFSGGTSREVKTVEQTIQNGCTTFYVIQYNI